jgi:hypothetical protein
MSRDLKKKCERAKKVVTEIERLSAERKKLYAEHDELVSELRGQPAIESFGIRLERTFEKGNTQWGHGPVREITIEIVENENDSASASHPSEKEPRPKVKGKA